MDLEDATIARVVAVEGDKFIAREEEEEEEEEYINVDVGGALLR
jgi:hypothetical protein